MQFQGVLSDANTNTEVDNNLKTYRNRQLDPEAQSDCETDNTSINETSSTQEVNADHEESLSSFKNSTSIILAYNESDIESNIFEKFFKTNDVFSIDNSWRTAIIFSKEESFENENEKFTSDEMIYKAMTKINTTSCHRWVQKDQYQQKLFENNYEREKGSYFQFDKLSDRLLQQTRDTERYYFHL